MEHTQGTTIECRSIYGKTIMIPRDRLAFRPSVYAIIPNKENILLIRSHHNGKYFLPGGGIELGERIETALKREIKEEAGIEIKIIQFLHFHEDFFYYDPLDEAYHSLLFYYICQPMTFDLLKDGDVNDDDAECPRWINRNTIETKDFQNYGEIIMKFLKS